MKTIKDIQKKYGEDAIFKLSDEPLDMDRISTGLINLDNVIGGGIPRGRVTLISGPESSGKSTLCQQIVASVQASGGVCAYVDVEHTFDRKYAAICGVNIDELYVSQPDSGEVALEIVHALVKSGELACVIVDSVAALVPRAEIEGEMGDVHVGLQARLMSQAMRKLTAPVKDNNVILIFTNQIRQKIGSFYGSNEVLPGGNALAFYSSIHLDLRKIKTLKRGNEAYGEIIRVKVKKNKTAPPFMECELTSYQGVGFSRSADLLNIALEKGVIEKSHSWYVHGDHREQGEAAIVEYIEGNFDEVYAQCQL